MKPKHHSFILALFFSCYANVLLAQTIEEQMTKSHPSCYTMFMNAMDVLPQLYREKSFDSLNKAVEVWERTCSDMPEVRITRILLTMEERHFNVLLDVDAGFLEMLNNQAKSISLFDKMGNISSYNQPEILFYRFTSTWARLLLENKKLSENEKFICRVLKGEIVNPEREIKQNAETYPEFAAMLDKSFETKRKSVRGNFALSTGMWLPTRNLKTLGIHPSFGIEIGARNERHQIDLSMQFRYLNSPNTYIVNKNQQSFPTDHYFGGYIGLNYTYYLLSKKRLDIGVQAGMGFDGFDFANYNDYYYNQGSMSINSFNGNTGLRFNYYCGESFYIALQSRYNGIHYSTHGGTNLSGDAISIDLIFGFNGDKSMR